MGGESARKWWWRCQRPFFVLGFVFIGAALYLMAVGNGRDLPFADTIRGWGMDESVVLSRRGPVMEPLYAALSRIGFFIGGGLILIGISMFVPTWYHALFTWSHIGGGDDGPHEA